MQFKRRMAGSRHAGWLSLVVGLSTATSLAAAPLPASPPVEGSETETDRVAAQLFRQGRQWLEQGRLAAACNAFARSLQHKTSPGTLLNLGRCREAEGKFPQAFLLATQALHTAKDEPDEAKRSAWQRGARIESNRLSRTVSTLDLKEVDRDGWRIRVDQRDRSELSAAPSRPHEILLNPGEHQIELFHPMREATVQEVVVTAGQVMRIAVPAAVVRTDDAAAERMPPVVPAPPPRSAQPSQSPLTIPAEQREDSPSSSNSPWVSNALLVTGGALVAAGLGTGLNTLRLADGLTESCLDETCTGSNTLAVANRWATATNVLWAAGVVSLGVGLVLAWGDDGDSSSAAARFHLQCHWRHCGAQARFAF